MRVQRKIEPPDITAILRMKEMIKTLPQEKRVCPTHGEEVTIKDAELLRDQVAGVPFVEAHWEGCCDEAITRVSEGVRKTWEQIDLARQTYRDELARKLEPDHKGEIVAIELGTNNYFVGEDEVEAADKARVAGHSGLLYFLRVGFPYTHRLMTPRS